MGYQRNILIKCFSQRARCENGKKWNLARSCSKLELTFFCNISLSNLSRSSYFDPFRNARTGWDTKFNGTGIGWQSLQVRIVTALLKDHSFKEFFCGNEDNNHILNQGTFSLSLSQGLFCLKLILWKETHASIKNLES